jgi:hypothetical protein
MYTGSYHAACRRAAAALTTPDWTLILSAKHGLMRLTQVIDPYELRLGRPGAADASWIQTQANMLGVRGVSDVFVLAGRDYRELTVKAWPDARCPLDGVGGIGPQLAALSLIANASAPTPRTPQPAPATARRSS